MRDVSYPHHTRTAPAVPEPLAYSVATLSAVTSLGGRTLRRLDSARAIPGRFRAGGRVLYRADAIRRWVAAGMPLPEEWAALGIA